MMRNEGMRGWNHVKVNASRRVVCNYCHGRDSTRGSSLRVPVYYLIVHLFPRPQCAPTVHDLASLRRQPEVVMRAQSRPAQTRVPLRNVRWKTPRLTGPANVPDHRQEPPSPNPQRNSSRNLSLSSISVSINPLFVDARSVIYATPKELRKMLLCTKSTALVSRKGWNGARRRREKVMGLL